MKRTIALTLGSTLSMITAVFAADNGNNYNNNGKMNPNMNMDQKNMQQQMSTNGDCAKLNTEEQAFAAKLTSTNAANFCSKMNPSQRQKAMQMTTTPDSTGTMMNPNDAVQKVMQDSGMTQMRSGGACPVK